MLRAEAVLRLLWVFNRNVQPDGSPDETQSQPSLLRPLKMEHFGVVSYRVHSQHLQPYRDALLVMSRVQTTGSIIHTECKSGGKGSNR